MTNNEIKKRLHNGSFAEAFESLDLFTAVKLFFQSFNVINDEMDEDEVAQIRPHFQEVLLNEAIPAYERYLLLKILCLTLCTDKKRMLCSNNPELLKTTKLGLNNDTYLDKDDFYKIDYLRYNSDKIKNLVKNLTNPESDECKQFFENFESNVEKWEKK